MSCPFVLGLVSYSYSSFLVPQWSFILFSFLHLTNAKNSRHTYTHTSAIEAGLRGLRGLSGAFVINWHKL